MHRVIVLRQAVNIEALHEELLAIAGVDFFGLSTQPGHVIAHLEARTDSTTIEQVRSAIINHDAMQLSASQQAEQTRQQNLQTLRSANNNAIDVDDYLLQIPLIQELAAKIAWLEQEIIDVQKLEGS